jgi:methylmalonyl-CoA/ethylmalonyl-CoA epimerase
MLKVKNIDHVAIAVRDLGPAAAGLAGLFGLAADERETVANQKTDVIFLHASGGPSAIELICPSAATSGPGQPGNEGLQRFLDKRGPGLHHVCFEVDDLAAALGTLRAAGVPLLDEAPRPGARGHLVAFIHPRAAGGVLFELCQKSPGAPPGSGPKDPSREGTGTL